ncbi:GNAT family N-acetyltransferase [Noviherbaspirillum sp. ST9]|uniref:GNAT family N-acetyltransferase n=1 Tax=Noviherbaspirillum sp. ST9 TaxID=3401606 RepID=UPI003B587F7F
MHDNEVPSFVGPELDRLYGTLYSSLAYFRHCASLEGVSTYVAYRDGTPAAVFLFRREGSRIRVVNEGMRLDADEVLRFARHMFAQSPLVDVIEFHAVQTAASHIPLLRQQAFCAEDFIVPLPSTPQEYLARLGPATRKNLKRHRHRLERDFPTFRHAVYERTEADEGMIRHIIELSRVRIAAKGMAFAIDEEEAQRIVTLVRQCGAVLAASIDGRICGGTLLYRFGKNCISRVNTHEAEFDSYRLGMLCCYLAACHAIETGAERFHLGHSWYDYKTALLGEFQAFHHLALYRSPGALVRHAGSAFQTACKGATLAANRWVLHRAGQGHTLPWRLAGKALAAWRAAKSLRGR